MSLTILGLFFLLMTSLQNIGADNDLDFMTSDDQYLNFIVSFWKINSDVGERKLLCLGALIASNWIFVTKTCYNILRESKRTVICTGSSYFDDIDINFIIKSIIEFPKISKFIILVINVDIEKSSSFQIFHMELPGRQKYRAVLVGWSEKNGQPLIEPFTFTSRQNKMWMEEDNRNKTELDFLEGSFAVMGMKIIAVSYMEYDSIRFHKIFCFEPEKVASELRHRNKENTNLQYSSGIDNKRKITITSKDYTNILVSLWKMVSEKEYYILCIGALIKSNWIFVTTQCSDKLNPLEDVGILTGMNKPSDTPERILSSKKPFRDNSEFIILVLNRDIELSSPIRIGVVTTRIHETDKSGVLLGWNRQKGRMNKPFPFKNEERLLLVSGAQSYSDEDFPLGSIAIKGRNIIGFTYLEKQNNVDENGMVPEITTISEKKILLSKIAYADFTKVHLLLRKGTCDNDNGNITDVDYFNFVVSLWREKNPKENNPEKFELLCLGALIKSTLILVNNDCFTEVSSFSWDNIGILSKSMLVNQLPPKTKVFIHHYPLSDVSKYTILVMNEEFKVLSQIRVNWLPKDDTEKHYGTLLGWNRKDGPVIKRIFVLYEKFFCIPFTAFEDDYELSQFPLGSLVIMGKNLKASTTKKPAVMEEKHGIIDRRKSEGLCSISTFKFTQRDSGRAKMFLHQRKMYTKSKKSICEKNSSSKKARTEKKPK